MHIFGTKSTKTSFGATDFLRANDKLAALLPTAMRIGRLQQDVARAVPMKADVLSFENGVLTLAAPNAAVATRLKQQLASLTAALQKKGWAVEQIRLKIQVTQAAAAPAPEKRTLAIPETGVRAFEALGESLEPTQANAPLIAAVQALAARRRGGQR